MKKEISLIGIGPGSESFLIREAEEKIREADIIIGAKRMLQMTEKIRKRNAAVYPVYMEKEVFTVLKKTEGNAVVLYSGDVGFYSGAKGLLALLKEEGQEAGIYPGISSVVYLAAKCKVSWQNAAFVSMHGVCQNVVWQICRHECTFVLMGGRKSADMFLEKMDQYGMNELEMTVGTNLSMENERIRTGKIKDFTPDMLEGLTILMVHNPDFDRRISRHLEDGELIRGKVPMTKSQIRLAVTAALGLTENAVLYDVGAGTGSVSVEAALQDGSIRVFAIERKKEAQELIRANKKKFRTDNVEIISGTAPEVLQNLPAPTHVFLGGTGGLAKEITAVCLKKNPHVRIVMSAVSLETISEMTALIKEAGFRETSVTQIAVSEAKKLGEYHMMMAQNPVYVAVLAKGEADEK